MAVMKLCVLFGERRLGILIAPVVDGGARKSRRFPIGSARSGKRIERRPEFRRVARWFRNFRRGRPADSGAGRRNIYVQDPYSSGEYLDAPPSSESFAWYCKRLELQGAMHFAGDINS